MDNQTLFNELKLALDNYHNANFCLTERICDLEQCIEKIIEIKDFTMSKENVSLFYEAMVIYKNFYEYYNIDKKFKNKIKKFLTNIFLK